MSDATERVKVLVRAARAVADAESELGRRSRALLVESTGLSPAGVELALRGCLETSPSADELRTLVASVEPAPRVHVILPSNVFIAAHRAVALALAASPHVEVRASRREPHLARALAEAAPGLFTLVNEVRAEPGDHVWAYGGDATLEAVRRGLPAGVRLHAQGPGYGVAVVDAAHVTAEAATALAADIVPFEQRGCLSPVAALVAGTPSDAERFAELMALALTEAAVRVPPGRLDDAERADARRFRDAHAYAGVVLAAGPGCVAVSAGERLTTAPAGRNLVVTACRDPLATLAPEQPSITAVGIASAPSLRASLVQGLPQARFSPLGAMQKPAFDGPADRRRRA
jgi:hypothetical protein